MFEVSFIQPSQRVNLESEENCIGTDSYEQSSANLAILGGNITAHVNGYGVYSAIGTGYSASMGDILIGGNATVKAYGGCYGAGIGSGNDSSVGNITITGNAYVNAKGNFGAGIGTAYSNGLDKDDNPIAWSTAGNITIDGNATVKALSSKGAAIGNGSSYSGHTTVGDILIGGNANVEAICAIHDGGVGGGCGTGIGNGYTSSPGSTSTTGNITITDAAQVVAKNYGYGLGLGKGITESDNTNTMGKITFSDGNVTIQNSGTDGSIEINGETYSTEEKMVFVDGKFVADGNDAIVNQTSNITVTGTTNADLIYNHGKNVLIDALGDNDDIFNMTSDVTINAGNGNNFITSRDDNVSIKAGTGNDSISAFGMANTIDAGEGDNIIFNYQSEVSIKTGAGSDTIMHLGYGTNPNIVGVSVTGGKFNSTIDTGAGNDSIDNGSALVSINAGAGNDTIDNSGSFSMINAGAGNDYITISGGENFTINAGKGDDFIKNSWGHGKNILFTYAEGDGNDTIIGFSDTSSIQVTQGKFDTLIHSDGLDLVLDLGENSVTLSAAAHLNKVTVLDSLGNQLKTVIERDLIGTTDADTFQNIAEEVSILSGEGKDTISNTGDHTTISGGADDDSIINGAVHWTVNGSGWSRYGADYVSIDGGAGVDSIENSEGSFVTLNGGKGDDYIYNATYNDHGKNVLFKYSSGDGNDIVYGFNETSTLSISGNTYTTQKSGSNILVTVGEGKITLIGAASLSKLNISGKEKNSWKLNGKTATYGTSKKTLATVKGVKSTDGLSLKKKVITVAASALNKKKVTVSDGYTLKLGSDVIKTSTKKAWSLSKDTAAYKKTTTAGYKLADNSITYSKKAAETLATVKGVKTLKGISLKNNVVTIKAGSLSAEVAVSGEYEFNFAAGNYKGKSISGSSGKDTITSHGKKLSINGGAGDDVIKILGTSTTVAGGKGDDSLWGGSGKDTFIYTAGDGNDVIYGFGDNDTLTIDNLNFTSSYRAKDKSVLLTFADGSITLKDFTAKTFHINSNTYKIKGSKLK